MLRNAPLVLHKHTPRTAIAAVLAFLALAAFRSRTAKENRHDAAGLRKPNPDLGLAFVVLGHNIRIQTQRPNTLQRAFGLIAKVQRQRPDQRIKPFALRLQLLLVPQQNVRHIRALNHIGILLRAGNRRAAELGPPVRLVAAPRLRKRLAPVRKVHRNSTVCVPEISRAVRVLDQHRQRNRPPSNRLDLPKRNVHKPEGHRRLEVNRAKIKSGQRQMRQDILEMREIHIHLRRLERVKLDPLRQRPNRHLKLRLGDPRQIRMPRHSEPNRTQERRVVALRDVELIIQSHKLSRRKRPCREDRTRKHLAARQHTAIRVLHRQRNIPMLNNVLLLIGLVMVVGTAL
eukprot:comp22450_c0_seq1/m.55203 comp22450_c0_seq1/g.55203  ORF comp22450_c0_seq1/g.55203 comp22450_c0_seq1/m.55203 type:complete len:344 (-) comp22450_c0_seq1:1768-2799(-)